MPRDVSGRLAAALTNKNSKSKAPAYALQKGVVTDINYSDGTVSVLYRGKTVDNIPSNSNYVPQIGDTVWMDVNGNSTPRITDRAGFVGPSVFSNVEVASVAASESLTTTTYTDLATFGPSVTTTIGPSGTALVTVSANILTPSNSTGASMAAEVSGASSVAASDGRSLMTDGSMNASRTALLTGLTPGVNTFTAKYRSWNSGDTGTFSNRIIWVVPL